MIIVERQQFINWTNGIFLDFKRGKGIIVNERMCQKAHDSAQKGEEIGFTIDGELISTAKLDKKTGNIVEKRIKSKKSKKKGK